MLRFDDSVDITSAKTIRINHPLPTKGLLIRYTGTNKAGQTLATSDLGTLSFNRGSIQNVNVKATHLDKWNDLSFGTILKDSTEGGDFDINLYLPFFNPYNPHDLNAIRLSTNDYLSIPAVSTDIVSDATVSIYIDAEDRPTLYEPKIYTRTETLSEEKPIFLPSTNLCVLMFDEPTTKPTQVILTRDGELVLDVPYEIVEIYTNIISQIESGTKDFVVLSLGELPNIRGKEYGLKMIGGGGTLTYTTFALDYTAPTGQSMRIKPLQIGYNPPITPQTPKLYPVQRIAD